MKDYVFKLADSGAPNRTCTQPQRLRLDEGGGYGCDRCPDLENCQDILSVNQSMHDYFNELYTRINLAKRELEVNAFDIDFDPMEPDYEQLAKEEPTSQYRDSRDSAGI